MTRLLAQRRRTPSRGSFAPDFGGVSQAACPTSEILHLTGMGSTKYGGFERYLVELARQCHGRGYRLVVQFDEPPRSKRYARDMCDAGAIILIHPLGRGRVRPAGRAVRLVARRRPCVVHLHFSGNSTRLAVGLLAHAFGVARTLTTVHMMPGSESRVLARLGYAHLDRVLCVSRAVERAIVGIGVPAASLATHYWGAPELDQMPKTARAEVRESLKIPPCSPVLVTVAFNNTMKGVDILIAAFLDDLAPAFPDLHLVIVGIAAEECSQISPRAGMLPDRMHWVGIQDDVRPFLTAANMYVQSSRTEGLPLAVIEAMRESLPVVATRVGGTAELVEEGQTGLLVEAESPNRLAAAIRRLLTDEDLARRLGRSGHTRWKTCFTLDRSVNELLDDHYNLSDSRL
jgi:glycosyltransferase involved in cell wall biosynthesis